MLPISIKFVKKPDFLKSKYSNFFIANNKQSQMTLVLVMTQDNQVTDFEI